MTIDDLSAQLIAEIGERVDLTMVDRIAIEAYAGQLLRMRAARRRADQDLLREGERGVAVSPAVEIERAASAELRQWVSRRPDLFATAKPEEVPAGDGRSPKRRDVLDDL
ncbi:MULTISPECIES: hypothetical protein [unclassified Dietzia]|uniref:hypothetical protein n=1 Tax=unclassified Dietzia TaxID=2617939 RepID=UPI0015F87952|nr:MULTISPECIES: hypothetical protein [unclassified Dietzia]MBB1022954.1 hypothetical protein [Dietzia sp. DQ12-76]MBB1026460.1 hypothetical protein [Dietzia sp. DQ11-38-2]